MSTEAAGVPVGSDKYWVDADANKKKKTNVVIKLKHVPKPKADSTTASIGWIIVLKAAVVACARRSVKSQARRRCTTPHLVSACLHLPRCNKCCNFCVVAALPELICTLPMVVHVG